MSKNVLLFLLSFMFFLQNQRIGEGNRFCGGEVTLVGWERRQGKQ
jgi:hypothetical protein